MALEGELVAAMITEKGMVVAMTMITMGKRRVDLLRKSERCQSCQARAKILNPRTRSRRIVRY